MNLLSKIQDKQKPNTQLSKKLTKIFDDEIKEEPNKKENKIQILSILSSINKTREEFEISSKQKIFENSISKEKDMKIDSKQNIIEKESSDEKDNIEANNEEDHNGIYNDRDLLENHLFTKNIHNNDFIYRKTLITNELEKEKYSEKQIKQTIKDFFDCKDSDKYSNSILILSGNMNPNGSFLCEVSEEEDPNQEKIIKMDYYLIYEMWASRKNKSKNKNLLIILDCNYSGIWVDTCKENLHYMSTCGISIQASCDKKQKSSYIPNKGGLLLWNITQFNTNNDDDMILSYDDLNKSKYFECKDTNKDKENSVNINENDLNKSKSKDKIELKNDPNNFENEKDKSKNSADDLIFKNEIMDLNNPINNNSNNFLLQSNNSKNILGKDKSNNDYEKNLDNNNNNILKQRPKSIGFYFKVLKKFHLDVLINSWDDFLKIKPMNKKDYLLSIPKENDIDDKIKGADNTNNKMSSNKIETEKNKINGYFYKSNLRKIFSKKIGKIKFLNGTYLGEVKNKIPYGNGTFVLDEKKVYEGFFQNGVLNGVGILTENEFRYEGEFRNWKRHGKGKILYLNKDCYIGEFRNEKMEGLGLFKNRNGDLFYGNFKNDKKEGIGKITFFNGDEYKGEFSNNEKDGFGIYTYKNGSKFIGEFSKGKAQGVGIFWYPNGDFFSGLFENDLKEGIGVYNYANGDVLEGNFKKGQPDGCVYLSYANGDNFEGFMKNGDFNGFGVFEFNDIKALSENEKNIKNKNCVEENKQKDIEGKNNIKKGEKNSGDGSMEIKEIYEGKYLRDKKFGFGIYKYANGDVYKGIFFNGKKHGKGIYKYSNGDVYDGYFETGVMKGIGKMTYSNGDFYQGEFENNNKHGKGIYKYKSGNVYKGEFKDGVAEGKGIYEYYDGEVLCFYGEYRNDVRCGPGVVYLRNKTKFKCKYLNGKLLVY